MRLVSNISGKVSKKKKFKNPKGVDISASRGWKKKLRPTRLQSKLIRIYTKSILGYGSMPGCSLYQLCCMALIKDGVHACNASYKAAVFDHMQHIESKQGLYGDLTKQVLCEECNNGKGNKLGLDLGETHDKRQIIHSSIQPIALRIPCP